MSGWSLPGQIPTGSPSPPGVASIQGTYTGEVALSQQREPTSFVLTARGAGAPAPIATSISVTLTPAGDGTTELGYDADAAIGGLIAGVGQRMLASVARPADRRVLRRPSTRR